MTETLHFREGPAHVETHEAIAPRAANAASQQGERPSNELFYGDHSHNTLLGRPLS